MVSQRSYLDTGNSHTGKTSIFIETDQKTKQMQLNLQTIT